MIKINPMIIDNFRFEFEKNEFDHPAMTFGEITMEVGRQNVPVPHYLGEVPKNVTIIESRKGKN